MTKPTSFIWYELMTTDPAAARDFYGKVVGWDIAGFGGGDDYQVLKARDGEVGGIMAMPADACEAGARPAWMGYIGVDNVDATAERIVESGGALHKGPWDIPGVGRLAVVADPQGVPFMLLKGMPETPPPPDAPPLQAFKMGTPGHIGWNELHSTDWEAGFAFYSKLFGWTKDQAMDMGPMGTYQLFKLEGGDPVGAMFNSPDSPQPSWLFYFNVDEIAAARERVVANGGKVLLEPTEVPGDIWIVQASDPLGAMFALVGPRKP
jgi:uncharacterized protein